MDGKSLLPWLLRPAASASRLPTSHPASTADQAHLDDRVRTTHDGAITSSLDDRISSTAHEVAPFDEDATSRAWLRTLPSATRARLTHELMARGAPSEAAALSGRWAPPPLRDAVLIEFYSLGNLTVCGPSAPPVPRTRSASTALFSLTARAPCAAGLWWRHV
jgi:hypothetical protein